MRWNQWTRKHDGWVERMRRFRKLFADRVPEATGQDVAVVGVTVPEIPETAPRRGEK